MSPLGGGRGGEYGIYLRSAGLEYRGCLLWVEGGGESTVST
jgi:hypothetical protein